ncbi:MAG TPA: UDP-N-acetylmuramoyl-L-alanyl-D-glutamate--2,6-diaminopimelate ligase [Crocinitomicaceae bacterium]|nr:UDP-N-acetylmuramoyl-L-alanyl-D-glutamate--2,6-diaminopimelate ligase [Crocinitomicaceae bacterium]
MILKDLLYGVSIISAKADRNADVQLLTFDSREANENTLFFAVKGFANDGHDYIAKAIEQGCKQIVLEYGFENLPDDVAYIQVDNSAKALGIMASNFYGNPSEQLKLVGITGTNGKTTTATLSYELFKNLGYKVGLLSTVVNKIGDEEIPSTHTTPNPIALNKLLALMVEEGCTHCFMEVSSHAIVQQRIAGLAFDVAAFTNITHDHLDYHQTFKAYIEAKKMFFDNLKSSAQAITNADDKNGMVMLQNTKAKKYTYSLKSVSDFKAKIIENQFSGLVLNLDGNEFWTQLIGNFNAYNLLLVYSIAILLEQDKMEVLTALSNLKSVEGRFQYVVSKNKITAIVDYAHTPDALENVLKTITDIRTKNEKVITVVGCGGDRDKAKRPEMAKIACNFSEQVILTSDNPRSEDPNEIIAEMQVGVEPHNFKKALAIVDRYQAIKTAFALAQPNDIILIAGKGHEKYQEIKGVKHDFDDMKIIKELFEEL